MRPQKQIADPGRKMTRLRIHPNDGLRSAYILKCRYPLGPGDNVLEGGLPLCSGYSAQDEDPASARQIDSSSNMGTPGPRTQRERAGTLHPQPVPETLGRIPPNRQVSYSD